MTRITLALVVVAVSLAAQEPVVGARTGLLVGGFTGNAVSSFRPGFTVGPTVTVPVASWLTIQSGVTYSGFSVGWTAPTPASATLRQLTVPVVGRFGIPLPGLRSRLTILAGGYTSYALQCRVSVGDGSCRQPANDLTPFANLGRWDGGPMAGLGLMTQVVAGVQVGAEVWYQQGVREVGAVGSGLHQRAWSVAFRLTGPGTPPAGGSYIDSRPEQHTAPHERAPIRPRQVISRTD